jgi:mono/diheme cytochrome c family protein
MAFIARLLIKGIVFLVAAVILLFLAIKIVPETMRVALEKLGPAALAAKMIPPKLPSVTDIKSAHWLPQNWQARDRYWFHHVTQGTATFPMPYKWFIALEQPGVPWTVLGPNGKFADNQYLRRFGFIPSPPQYENKPDFGKDYGYEADSGAVASKAGGRFPAEDYPDNPDRLPVGFAKLKADPKNGLFQDRIGLTCAACHTGHIEYKNVSLRFDGGAAAINLQEYEKAIALALVYTKYLPCRFGRFADNILGKDRHPVETRRLRQQLSTIVDTILTRRKWTADILENNAQKDTDEGFARLDALNRIGNQVFFEAMLPLTDPGKPNAAKAGLPPELTKNFASVDAPVSFPPIWSVSWFRWAQYDASVHNELIRNAGEALGVKAIVNLIDNGAITLAPQQKWQPFRSSVKMENIFWIEKLLAGPNPFAPGTGDPAFKGLQAPRWTDAGKYFSGDAGWQLNEDSDIVKAGRALYQRHCVECHQGPVRDPAFDRQWPKDSIWARNDAGTLINWTAFGGGPPYLDNVQKPVPAMGTDPQQSRVLTERQVYLPQQLDLNPIQYLNEKENCRLPNDDSLNRSFVLALMAVVGKTIDQWFEDHRDISADLKNEMRGQRTNCPNPKVYRRVDETERTKAHAVVAPHYRARPLDGVWATAPYLHNGSVPTLDDMLRPQKDRPKSFCVGSRQFDPEKVGLAKDDRCRGFFGRETGLFRFKTWKLGNSNLGHSFEAAKDAPKSSYGPGIIGPKLDDDERKALVAYLKTL